MSSRNSFTFQSGQFSQYIIQRESSTLFFYAFRKKRDSIFIEPIRWVFTQDTLKKTTNTTNKTLNVYINVRPLAIHQSHKFLLSFSSEIVPRHQHEENYRPSPAIIICPVIARRHRNDPDIASTHGIFNILLACAIVHMYHMMLLFY